MPIERNAYKNAGIEKGSARFDTARAEYEGSVMMVF
jgi:hypothetical protein